MRRFSKASTLVTVQKLVMCCLILFAAAMSLTVDNPAMGYDSTLCQECNLQEQACLADGDERMEDCLDAAEETAAARCAELSDNPTANYYSLDPAAGVPEPVYDGPSERQQCEEALLMDGRYNTPNVSISTSVSSTGAISIGASVSSSTSTTTGLYNRCQEKYGPDLTREADCREERRRCERMCLDAF